MRRRQGKFGEWLWRAAETAAVLTVIAWIWMWIYSPPGDGRLPRARRSWRPDGPPEPSSGGRARTLAVTST